jgi:hypothetical protein
VTQMHHQTVELEGLISQFEVGADRSAGNPVHRLQRRVAGSGLH